jgi:hypothetical protein
MTLTADIALALMGNTHAPAPDGVQTCALAFTMDGSTVRIEAEMGRELPGLFNRVPGTLFLNIATAQLYRLDVTSADRIPEREWVLLVSGVNLEPDILAWSAQATVASVQPTPPPPRPTRGRRRTMR